MNYVQRKGTTSKRKRSGKDFEKLKAEFLDEIKSIVTMEEIPAELVMNWDQTGLKLFPHHLGLWRNVEKRELKLLVEMINGR